LANLVPLDVLAALDELDLEYTVTGNEAKALCPHPDHDDTSPSWSINLDSGMHHCFSCGFGGSFVYLVIVWTGKKGEEASEWVRRRKVKDISEGKTERKADRQKYAEITEADLWEFDYAYPQDELEYRGFDYPEARWFSLMWDHKRDGWIIPFSDAEDKLIGYQFKPRHGTDGTPINHPTHLKKSGRIFEGLNYIDGDTLVIVESPLDVVRLYALGYENVVALFGASMDAEQAELIMEKFDKVILAFDDDDAGRRGISKALKLLNGVEVWIFAYTDPIKMATYYVHGKVTGKDPGDLTRDEFQRGLDRATKAFRTGFQ
jgi:DNA primase